MEPPTADGDRKSRPLKTFCREQTTRLTSQENYTHTKRKRLGIVFFSSSHTNRWALGTNAVNHWKWFGISSNPMFFVDNEPLRGIFFE
ncbi:hypothetical protein JTE90_012478 [Oedothorax gibbosus]|uniref:Uncharacterized protein n=1 Tax=Oedothorax gibbosus TaxID=931172 RepID=A0AAV6UEG9_9ARAC|nr:hypothetical protein JTE90_012478 [Oedothorax gibbosus]